MEGCDHYIVIDGLSKTCDEYAPHYFSVRDSARRLIIQMWACDHHREFVRAQIHKEARYFIVEESRNDK